MTVHIPILLDPIVEGLVEPFLKLPENAQPHWIVDCTLGGGGHTGAFLKALQKNPALTQHRVLAIDQDEHAIEAARIKFKNEIDEGRLTLLHARFSEIDLTKMDGPVLGLLADLGFSSDQLGDAERGLSFQSEGPLDMRLDPSRGRSCRDYLFQVTEAELVDVLQNYGEERFSRRIAHAIISARRDGLLPKTTKELSELILKHIPPEGRHGRIHGATRTFQALRIVVNEELDELDKLLSHVILSVKAGGRVAIISFHSLEDRKVKQAFKGSDHFRQLTKKPIEADDAETERNPRSRSAKLRIAERLESES